MILQCFESPRNFRYLQKGLESVTHALSVGTNQESLNYNIYLNYLKLNVALRFRRMQVDNVPHVKNVTQG
jgi:hypothetical protein